MPASVRPCVVAVDGPSGSGKSSVSRGVAAARGLAYLDTGAMYRAVTAAVLERGVDPTDPAAVAAVADVIDLTNGTDPNDPWVRVDGDDVSDVIRGEAVTAAVSSVSAVPSLRARLVRLQRAAVAEAVVRGAGIVVEGRDIGTVVLPDAPVKVYLVADPAVRAARRALQDTERTGRAAATALVESDLVRRDAADSARVVSPLQAAADAVVVDATDLELDEVVAVVLGLVDRAVS